MKGGVGIKNIFSYQDFLHIFQVIYSKLFDWDYENYLNDNFRFDKTKKLIIIKHYWITFYSSIKFFVKDY